MECADVELERQLKERGKQLSHPSDSIYELLSVLDQLEKLLLKVDQSPRKSMLDALKPSMKALIHDNLSKHSDVDVKVSVASCISEITRITAPDAPYDDDQMREVFKLIVSSFEDLADQSSRSYEKRASILETVSKVRSCVIMLDLECDALIVEMFEHFLRSVRDYHLESIYSSMENIMVLVLEESEEISVELLKPLLASVKKDNKGVLPVARKLGEGVLMKSADKLKPYLMPAVTSLGVTLDEYTKVVASICEGTTATVEQNDENESALQLTNGSILEKEGEVQQADESKITRASSDHADQVVKEGTCSEEVDATLDRSQNSVMSNGVNVTCNEEQASVDQEPSKKPDEEDINEVNHDNEDTDDSDAEKKSKPEETSKECERKSDTIANSNELSDSSHIEGDKEEEAEKPVPEIEKDSDVKESDIEPIIALETDKDGDDVNVSSPKPIESKPASVSSPSQSNSLPDESCVKKGVRSKKKQVPQQDEIASSSESGSHCDETRTKKVGPATKGSTQEDASEETGDLDLKPQKTAGKKAGVTKEVKSLSKDESEDGEASSDSEAPMKKSESKSKSTKQPGKKSKQSGKKVDPVVSDAKKSKQGAKKVDAKKEDIDLDDKLLKQCTKKGETSKVAIQKEDMEEEEDEEEEEEQNQEEESDSENKLIKSSAKTGNSKKKDQAKSSSNVDEMDSSPKSSAKGEGKIKETTATSAKRKRSTSKDKVSDEIKYDKSLVGLKVKVWWPEDKMYYEGVIDHFDAAKKKHKVSYLDGDTEILNLKTQKWEILQEFSVRDEEQEQFAEAQSEEASPETHKKKKSKTDSATSASQEKNKVSAKKVGGASSSSKAKGSSSREIKSTTAKSTSKKTGGKSNKEDEEAPKTIVKTKQETPKTVNKSKSKTPQAGSTKSGSSNAKEPEDVKTSESTKGKSAETTKSGSKTGKKRKKRT
ncbi:sister chromatid cohesion protein PDS5 homolog C-like [Rutidosis leptorrhynchoides]|uniref:sister chromatid cohesion protein PDS5 homolog C-like n=1 Tax=Rutidosis leptorrhynchoides TaxID=125765 RepID=UPI003A99055C